MWHLFSPGRETEDEDTQVTAQASVEEPGPNAQALNELPEVQPGEQVCPDLLKAEDFLDCHREMPAEGFFFPKSSVPMS